LKLLSKSQGGIGSLGSRCHHEEFGDVGGWYRPCTGWPEGIGRRQRTSQNRRNICNDSESQPGERNRPHRIRLKTLGQNRQRLPTPLDVCR
jgi:hypothetical protein